ncbi:3-oxoacyl-[acyl-carrier-protein] reductase [Butyrivibrio proteoclasticus]|uniref:3-oxoacyl-[acyl-carrier-protein] reductase n=1 Tax=Butyrivibrio proteoclasticus TaxID=43305 RepID=UPI000478C2A9|nr:3-oxoacyl-[acyl-carrier-protein] reductase [Butyrivibrio proteoclasticus]
MLKGKNVVITGGVRGIGFEIAKTFAQEEANLFLVASRESEAAKNAVEEIKALGCEVAFFPCDVKDNDAVEAMTKEILEKSQGIDILVNNAGITRDNLLPGLSITDIEEVLDTNLKGTMLVTRAFIRNFMKKKQGNIINISSVVGLMGNKGQTNYAASKAGIIGFTKSVAKEYGRKNIRCNAIAPGFIETDMTAKLNEAQVEAISKEIALGRLGSAKDVADLALFLASDRSRYITGEVIKVDGGLYV